ncbi:MAG: binding-protein-dependent transport system inner membrane protein [Dehalococcoidia bacterium]|nr:MAG: binding-protein-dependent transport system inner membrane protein [Dehalococcoidia bacterium]
MRFPLIARAIVEEAPGLVAAGPFPGRRLARTWTAAALTFLRERLVLAVTPFTLAILWELAIRGGFSPHGIIPAPSDVAAAWYQWAFGTSRGMFDSYSGTWFSNAQASMLRVGGGFAIAALIGIPLGILIGWNRLVARLIDPTIQLARPIPITAWVPFAIAIFGIQNANALFLIFLGAFYPIVLNTTHGVRETSLNLIRAAKMLGAKDRDILLRVVLPSALPGILTGMRLGVGVGWMAVIVAEMIAVKTGLGYVLWDAYYVGRMNIVIADMISIGLFGFLSDRLILLLSRRLLAWRELSYHN